MIVHIQFRLYIEYNPLSDIIRNLIKFHNTFHNTFLYLHILIFDMCNVAEKRQTSYLNANGLRPPLTTRHTRCVLLVNSPNNLNLLSWLIIYLCNK